jgi:hypothetical protein
VSAVPLHRIDRRQGYLECELRAGNETSPAFVPQLGGELPDGWVVAKSKRFQPEPGKVAYLCPAHAGIDRTQGA